MKIAFIGANGFLANVFGKRLNEQSIHPIVYGKSEPLNYSYSSFIKFNILDNWTSLNMFCDYDLIFYFAGQGIQAIKNDKTSDIFEVNSFFPIKLILFLSGNNFKGKLVTFGSYFEIGNCNKEVSFTEINLIKSNYKVPNNYCVSKRIFTKFIDSFANNFIYHFILPTIYGEGEGETRLIPYIIGQIKKGMDIQLTSGSQIRQYIYVDDVYEIVSKTLGSLLDSGIYNIAGTETKEVKELSLEIVQYFGYKIDKIKFGSLKRVDTTMKYLLLNGSKLNSVIGLGPNTLIKDKLKSY